MEPTALQPGQQLPRRDTIVTFPDGGLTLDAAVEYVERLEHPQGARRLVLLTDRTPVHPIDPAWPDQPADRAVVTIGRTAHPLVDAVLGAVDPDGTRLYVGSAPVRRGTPGWSFVVCHILDADPIEVLAERSVTVEVDAAYRLGLSRAHTACHLTALALNQACARYWRREVRRDSLGAPDLDQLAIQRSQISTSGSVDEYRFGRTLRKAGLEAADLLRNLGDVQEATQSTLTRWLATDSPVSIHRKEPGAGQPREWVCHLPEDGATPAATSGPEDVQPHPVRPARLRCGGTHVRRLGDVGDVLLTFTATEDGAGLRVTTELADDAVADRTTR